MTVRRAQDPKVLKNIAEYHKSLPQTNNVITEPRIDVFIRRKEGAVEVRVKPDHVIIDETNPFMNIKCITVVDYKAGKKSQEYKPMPAQRKITCVAACFIDELCQRRLSEETPENPLPDHKKPFFLDVNDAKRRIHQLFEGEREKGGTIIKVKHQVVYLGGEKPEVDSFEMNSSDLLNFLKGEELNTLIHKAQVARRAQVRNFSDSRFNRLKDST